MAAYRYNAFDPDGNRCAGVISADSAKHARTQLREQGLLIDKISEVDNDAQAQSIQKTRRPKISRSDLAILTQQLATLLAAGLTLEQSLSALIEQAPRDTVREVMAGVRAGVNEGETLAKALGRYGEIFNPLYRALIEAGEMSGELPKIVDRLAIYSENVESFRQKTLLALLYPAIVSVVAILVIGGLVAYVVPQVIQVFEQSKQSLPLLTLGLIAISNFLRAYWWLLLGGVTALLALTKLALRNEQNALKLDRFLLSLPGIGYLLAGLDAIRLANTLAILIGGGVPMLSALRAGCAVMSNRQLKAALEDASLRVSEGMSLSRALARSKLFPPILTHLIASGEASGRLGSMLERAAQQQEREMQNRIALLTGILEPALIVVMGGVVMLVVLAILMPIIDINQLLTTSRG
ncbi:MAG: type II secretion system inner membrane protein GspF [Rhodocyclaceae bacterium]|nr:type II secretion system inner membrane protein GspF [Rhodocyclaceae bacterium]